MRSLILCGILRPISTWNMGLVMTTNLLGENWKILLSFYLQKNYFIGRISVAYDHKTSRLGRELERVVGNPGSPLRQNEKKIFKRKSQKFFFGNRKNFVEFLKMSQSLKILSISLWKNKISYMTVKFFDHCPKGFSQERVSVIFQRVKFKQAFLRIWLQINKICELLGSTEN